MDCRLIISKSGLKPTVLRCVVVMIDIDDEKSLALDLLQSHKHEEHGWKAHNLGEYMRRREGC